MAMFEFGDAGLETVDQCPQVAVLGGKSGVLGRQTGTLDEEFLGPVATSHSLILSAIARSVADDRALRATPL